MNCCRRIFSPFLVSTLVTAGLFTGGLFGTGLARAQTTSQPLVSSQAPRKLALLVGVNRYDKGKPGGWTNLHGADDVKALKQVLVSRFGFSPQDVVTLTDGAATRAGIVKAFDDALISKVKPGDVAVFSFSGHGQQLPDANADEADALDESLVTFDALSLKASSGLKTNLSDDQLGLLLDRLRAKMLDGGGQVAGSISLFLDTGFGGAPQQTPGALPQRGRAWNTAIDGAKTIAKTTSAKTTGAKTTATKKANPDGASGFFASGEAKRKGYAVLSAVGMGQTNREIAAEGAGTMGPLSLALTRALNRARVGATYDDLWQQLIVDMGRTTQSAAPQLEGDATRPLMAGAFAPATPYINISSITGNDILLPQGGLHGVTSGSIFSFFAPDADLGNEKARLAQGKIIQVTPLTSRARLTDEFVGKVDLAALKTARAVEAAHFYEDSPLKLWVNGVRLPPGALDGLTMVTTNGVTRDNADVILRPDTRGVAGAGGVAGSTGGSAGGSAGGGLWLLEKPDGFFLSSFRDDEAAATKLGAVLLNQFRLLSVMRLRNDDPGAAVKVGVRIVPVKVRTTKVAPDNFEQVVEVLGDVPAAPALKDNRQRLREGDYVMMEVRNASPYDIYATLLDLSPDGSVVQLYPEKQAPGALPINKIAADGKWHRIPMPYVFGIGKPFGTEMFKLLATRDPSNFRPLLQSGKVIDERGAPSNPLSRLLMGASTGKRAAEPEPSAEWGTAEITFIIDPR